MKKVIVLGIRIVLVFLFLPVFSQITWKLKKQKQKQKPFLKIVRSQILLLKEETVFGFLGSDGGRQ